MRAFDHTSMEYNPEMEAFEAEQFAWAGETAWEGETEVFNETESMELAHELLAVTNEAELDRFLGDLIQRAGQAIGGGVRWRGGQPGAERPWRGCHGKSGFIFPNTHF